MHIKTIVLDFDGVLVESVGIKDKSFELLFEGYPDHLDQIMQYHYSHNATIRFEKFEYVYKNILNLEYTDQIANELSKRFSELVFEQIIRCQSVTGADAFLNYFHKCLPLFIASINPSEEFARILKVRKLEHFFKRVYTYPWKKKDAIEDILDKEQNCKQDVIFVGDSPEDYEAAKAVGINFVGRLSNKSFNGFEIPIYRDLNEIKEYICGFNHS